MVSLNSLFKPALLIFFSVAFFSCKKGIEQDTPLTTQVTTGQTQVKNGPIPPEVFNWETATYAPGPTSSRASLPWNSGQTSIEPMLANDYHTSDGWRLVWSTFRSDKALGDANYTYFFSLYNIYRGLLRFYLWQPASSIATNYVNHGLSLYTTGFTSPILNFNAQEIVDANNKQLSFVNVLNQQINSAGGTWFVFQYEMAYDANIASHDFTEFGLSWISKWISESSLNINGNIIGTLKGNLGDPNKSDWQPGSIAQNAAIAFIDAGASTFAEAINPVSTVTDLAGSYVGALVQAGLGLVKGFLSGMTSGSSAKPISLTINAKVQLNGSIVTSGGLENMKLIVPGQKNSQTSNGNTPNYNSLLGLFNVTNNPKVNVTTSAFDVYYEDPYSGAPGSIGYSEAEYVVDDNSYQIIWNPAIVNTTSTGVTIKNLKKELVILDAYPFMQRYGSTPEYDIYQPTVYYGQYSNGTQELVGNYFVLVNNITNPNHTILDYFQSYGGYPTTRKTGVRISFDVYSNSTNQRIYTNAKTFLANLQIH